MRRSFILASIAALAALPAVVLAQTTGEVGPAFAPIGPNAHTHIARAAAIPDSEAVLPARTSLETLRRSLEASVGRSPDRKSKDDLALLGEWLESVGPVDGMAILVGRTMGLRFESRVESVDWKFAIEYERTLLELKGAIRYRF